MPVELPDSQEVRAALVELTEARRAHYYDEAADAQGPGQLLLRAKHRRRPRGPVRGPVRARHRHAPQRAPLQAPCPPLFRHRPAPNGQLRSIYTGEEFRPEAFIVEDARADQRRREALSVRLAAEVVVVTEEARQVLEAELEVLLPFNCEHVVPQSWFAKREPMRGDLHHLFACEVDVPPSGVEAGVHH